MPVPWEALIPFGMSCFTASYVLECTTKTVAGLLTAMFGVAGTLANVSMRAQNQGKVRVPDFNACAIASVDASKTASSLFRGQLGLYDDAEGQGNYGSQTRATGAWSEICMPWSTRMLIS